MVGASGDNLLLRAGSNERVRITNNGRVGINSTSPTVPLDVVGSGKFSSALTVGGTLNASGTCTLGQTVSLNGTNLDFNLLIQIMIQIFQSMVTMLDL